MMKSFNTALVMCMALASSVSLAEEPSDPNQRKLEALMQKQAHPLTIRQKSIALIAAYAASGDLVQLNTALNTGLDAGLSVSDCREALTQLYAYAGFPRSLNALEKLMKIVDARRLAGKHDKPGSEPDKMPAPDEMLVTGTRNQTALVGMPVKGALFEFAPAIDRYLKTHLFGDIFVRDNLDWKSRELATVGALSALSGVEPQLKSHLGISINIGLSTEQFSELVPYFKTSGAEAASQRLESALTSI
ncbi:carboxymuconolactone decarboxylase family protein [Serratia rubidaea]|uniref:carboxymuconolactone decarboxylase family protein n=1 Tax=Serratia rubidaea TaxID=61652 RepID=UPI000772D59D|nr:carboxymuconolactone decarboxylase family protein [Serratia rubidaea]